MLTSTSPIASRQRRRAGASRCFVIPRVVVEPERPTQNGLTQFTHNALYSKYDHQRIDCRPMMRTTGSTAAVTRRIVVAAAWALVACLSLPALAATRSQYPERPVRLIVPVAPGGGTDFISRFMAQR